jgi:hypothetical protein
LARASIALFRRLPRDHVPNGDVLLITDLPALLDLGRGLLTSWLLARCVIACGEFSESATVARKLPACLLDAGRKSLAERIKHRLYLSRAGAQTAGTLEPSAPR